MIAFYASGAVYVICLDAAGLEAIPMVRYTGLSSLSTGLSLAGDTNSYVTTFGSAVGSLMVYSDSTGDRDDLRMLVGHKGVEEGKGAVYVVSFSSADSSYGDFSRLSSSAVIGSSDELLLVSWDSFGAALAGLHDVNMDGLTDLAVGAPGHDEVWQDTGAVYIFSLSVAGEGSLACVISANEGCGFTAMLTETGYFGSSLSLVATENGDSDSWTTGTLAISDTQDQVYLVYLTSQVDEASTNSGSGDVRVQGHRVLSYGTEGS